MLGVAPVLAPTLGGELLRLTDRRGAFVALGAVGTALTVLGATSAALGVLLLVRPDR